MTRKDPIILGIDPGTKVTGYGVIQDSPKTALIDFGAIRPPSKLALHQRYHILYENIESLIQLYHPMVVVVENQFVQKNFQSAMKIGMAKAVVYLLAAKYELELFEYAPKQAKLAVVGNGSASKSQVQKMIQLLFGLKELPTPEDAADALSLAICHTHHAKWKKL